MTEFDKKQFTVMDDAYGISDDVAETGVPVVMRNGATWWIRHKSNPDFAKVEADLLARERSKPRMGSWRTNERERKRYEAELARMYADTMVTKWENQWDVHDPITGKQLNGGQPALVPFSAKAVQAYLQKYRKLFDEVVFVSDNFDLHNRVNTENDAGNLPSSSSSQSSEGASGEHETSPESAVISSTEASLQGMMSAIEKPIEDPSTEA